jgi:hypothetical protein
MGSCVKFLGTSARSEAGEIGIYKVEFGWKKVGPPLGIGGPGRRVSMPVSFSHRRVGSSILASLSEAGGNDLQKVTSKPLPPRSPLFTFRHLKRARVTCYCTGRAIS